MGPLQPVPGGFRATVEGSRAYEACLVATAGGPTWDCDCPIGEAGELCKHIVALGVVVLHRSVGRAPADPAGSIAHASSPPVPLPDLAPDDVAAWIRSLDAPRLATLLLEGKLGQTFRY